MNLGSTAGGKGGRHLDEAKAYIDRATALDAANARVLCALGRWHTLTGVAANDAEAIATGRKFLFAALSADDRLAEVQSVLGKMALFMDDDFHAAARAARRAVQLSPRDPEAPMSVDQDACAVS